jgi:hypothetical protein
MVNGILDFPNSVVTNAANITLTGHAAEIFNNVSSTNALSTLAANASTGVLSLQKGQVLATAINLSNAGKIDCRSHERPECGWQLHADHGNYDG